MSGHVFVVHGDLLKMSADVLLIPCDVAGEVLAHWHPYGPAPDRDELAAELQRRGRVSEARTIEGQPIRYVDTGADPSTATATWLEVGVRTGLAAAVDDALQHAAKHRRVRPVMAMPLFGVGEGGFDKIRGEALRAQLTAAQESVADANVDVAIVCFQRSDFAAVQRVRSSSGWDLPDELRDHAGSLAEAIKIGRLVLFLGAGVSAAAGIGDFAGLVVELERRAGVSDGERQSDGLPDRVAALQKLKDEKWLNDQVADIVSATDHYSLTHGLLASLRIHETITTNFDRLYEMSCERPFAESPLEVLPWQRTAGRNPWLLKAHGDPLQKGSLVFGTPSFDGFENDRASTAGVVRAMLALSREVLFVGYALRDENIAKLIDEADKTHQKFGVAHSRLGTILDIESTEVHLDQNPVRIGIQAAGISTIADAARRLQVWLDYLLWLATREEVSWLLDERYVALHDTDTERDAAKRLAEDRLPATENWRVVERRLRQFGRRTL